MSIFDVVDLNVTQRKAKAFALGEPPPPVFNQKLVADVPSLLENAAGAPAQPPDASNSQRVRIVIYVGWAAWFLCATTPHVFAISAADDTRDSVHTRPRVPFDCNLSFLSLFVTFPCLCVDVFCKWILHGRARAMPLFLHTVAVFMLVVSVQHRCLATKITSPATVVFVFSVALVLCCLSQTLVLGDKEADMLVARGRLWGFVCTGGFVCASCITALVGMSSTQPDVQNSFFMLHECLLVAGICLYALVTALTLSPLFFVCSHLNSVC